MTSRAAATPTGRRGGRGGCSSAGPGFSPGYSLFLGTMKVFLAFCVVLLVFGSVSEAKFDDFEDEEDIVEYDDNDFAEFEDVMEDSVTESPQRVITTEDDEDETTLELEGQDENQEGDFEDADTQEGDTESEPYDDEEFEGYEDKPDTSSSKNKDPITIVDGMMELTKKPQAQES